MMKKSTLICFSASMLFSGVTHAGACEASSPEDIAKTFGISPTDVTEELTYERKTTSECMWSFNDANGFGLSITYRTFDKTEKITNPDFFKNNQKHLVENGNKVGKWELKYSFEALPGTEHGIISEPFGSKYTSTLHYIWIEGEERRLGVTFNISANDEGKMRQPTLDDIKQAVAIFTN